MSSVHIIKSAKKALEPTKPAVSFYSIYGYVQVYKADYSNDDIIILPFFTHTNMTGYINKKNLLQEITIQLKTFHGSRKTYRFTVNINSQISNLLYLLYEGEDKQSIPSGNKWLRTFQYRFIASRQSIRDLNPNSSFAKNLIVNDETLILLPQKTLSFSDKMKGDLINIVHQNKIALKCLKDEPQYVLGDLPMEHGRYYFEVTLVTEPIARGIIVGIAIKKSSTNLNVNDVISFYGFVLSEMKKISSVNYKIDHADFGSESKIGDKIGVLVEFNEEGVDLSFYINKKLIGMAFNKLPQTIYFPCLTLGLNGAKAIINNQVEFPDT